MKKKLIISIIISIILIFTLSTKVYAVTIPCFEVDKIINFLNEKYDNKWIEYLKEKISYSNQILEERIERPGMLGRLTIPDKNIDVAIYNSDTQETIDKTDSATYFAVGDMIVIGDHDYQAFKNLKKCKEGTKLYIDNGIEVKEYICVKSFKGHNTVYDLTDEDYNSILENNAGGLTLYTCNGHWKNIWICFFQLI